MNMIVPIKLVPDLVEELVLNQEGTALDPDSLRLKLNEFDDHAIEQALLLKERGFGPVIVVALDVEGADDALFTACAKGADRIIKLSGDFSPLVNNHDLARWLAPVVKDLQGSLVLTGVQAHNDLDGPLGALLAEYLGMPYIGYVASVRGLDSTVIVRKEFPNGLAAEVEVYLPAVLGIQAAEKPPRYVAFSKVRQAMKTVTLENRPIPAEQIAEPGFHPSGSARVERMYQPQSGEHAEMLDGDPDQVAARLVEILAQAGILSAV